VRPASLSSGPCHAPARAPEKKSRTSFGAKVSEDLDFLVLGAPRRVTTDRAIAPNKGLAEKAGERWARHPKRRAEGLLLRDSQGPAPRQRRKKTLRGPKEGSNPTQKYLTIERQASWFESLKGLSPAGNFTAGRLGEKGAQEDQSKIRQLRWSKRTTGTESSLGGEKRCANLCPPQATRRPRRDGGGSNPGIDSRHLRPEDHGKDSRDHNTTEEKRRARARSRAVRKTSRREPSRCRPRHKLGEGPIAPKVKGGTVKLKTRECPGERRLVVTKVSASPSLEKETAGLDGVGAQKGWTVKEKKGRSTGHDAKKYCSG